MKMMQDDKGNTSSMRMGMMISVCSGCACAILGVLAAGKPGSTIDLFQVTALSTGLVGAGLGLKAVQKNIELKQ